jgi:hypothetical protein
MHLKEIGWGVVDWIHLAFTNTVMNVVVPYLHNHWLLKDYVPRS